MLITILLAVLTTLKDGMFHTCYETEVHANADLCNIVVDDMISSGESMLDVARQLKDRKANRIFCASTFGLFTNGLDKFDEFC